jgi:transcriptional regulator with XRE-family HTH domain
MLADLAMDGGRRLGYVPVVGSEIQHTDGIPVEFARWLRSVLEKNGLSIGIAAARAGLSKTTVGHWSHGDSMPSSERDFKPLADVLGCSLGDFYIQTNTLYRSAARHTSRTLKLQVELTSSPRASGAAASSSAPQPYGRRDEVAASPTAMSGTASTSRRR